MTTEHSEQAKARAELHFPSFNPANAQRQSDFLNGVTYGRVSALAELQVSAKSDLDLKLTERRTAEREAIARTLYRVSNPCLDWDDATESARHIFYQCANAILALPAAPYTTTREALKFAADIMEEVIARAEITEAIGNMPDSTGYYEVLSERDALLEDPVGWLRTYADEETDEGENAMATTTPTPADIAREVIANPNVDNAAPKWWHSRALTLATEVLRLTGTPDERDSAFVERIAPTACPAVSPSDMPCIGRAEWHEVHADRVGSTWRDYAGKVPGLTHAQLRKGAEQ